MGRTLQQLVEAVALNDYEKYSEMQDELEEWINEGYFEIADRNLSCFEKNYTFDTTDGDYEYDLPNDCRTIVGIYGENGAIEWNDIKRFNRNNPVPSEEGQGRPKYATIFGNKLYLNPTPNDSYTINIWYYKIPERLTQENPNHVLPNNRESMLVEYATAKYNEREKDYQKTNSLMRKFYAKLEDWEDDDYEKVEDSTSLVELEREFKRGMRRS